MPAMHDSVFDAMESILAQKLDYMMRLVPFSMTHEECLSLICTEEHKHILLQASEYANVSASEAWMTVSVPACMDNVSGVNVMLKMRTHGQKSPPLGPRAPAWQMPENPHQVELGERVIQWADKRLEYGRRFGATREVLRYLNHVCTGAQLRYVFPGVVHLCKMGVSPRMDTWLSKYGAFKPVMNTPALSLPMREAVRDATALMTSVMLVGDDVPEKPEGFVDIAIWNLPAIKVDGNYVRRL